MKNRKKNTSLSKTLMIAAAVILCYTLLASLVEFDMLNRQFKSLIVPIGVNIILAVSLNLVTGFLGELSLGHAGFMLVGAYSSTLFSLNFDLPGFIEFFLAILIGGVTASLFGFIIGIPVLRLRGDYLAIVTLAFNEIIRSLINSMTFPSGRDKNGEFIMKKGTMGLSGIETYANYTWVFIAVLITVLFAVNLINSRHGRVITSIRDNYIAAESIGIRVSRYKIMCFVIAAFFAGIAGAINGHNLSGFKSEYYGYERSIDILVFVVLGGMGSIRGSIIAATVLTLLPELLRPIKEYRMLMYAVLLISMMLFNNSNIKARLMESRLGRLVGRNKTRED